MIWFDSPADEFSASWEVHIPPISPDDPIATSFATLTRDPH